LAAAWPIWTNRIDAVAQLYDFDVCDDCVTALKHSICSSFTPSCGFLECVATYSQQLGSCQTTCSTECSDPSSGSCYVCATKCAADIIYGNCKSFMMSNTMCKDLLNICGCNTNPTDVAAVCAYFANDGYTVPYPAGLSCEGTKNWCQTKNTRALPDAGVIKINDHLSIGVPQAVGTQNTYNPIMGDTTVPLESSSSWVIAPMVSLVALAYLL